MKVIGNPRCDKFKITIHFEWVATPEEIFGCQPAEDPTVEDVVKEITACGSAYNLIKEWCLEDGADDDGSEFIITVTPST